MVKEDLATLGVLGMFHNLKKFDITTAVGALAYSCSLNSAISILKYKLYLDKQNKNK